MIRNYQFTCYIVEEHTSSAAWTPLHHHYARKESHVAVTITTSSHLGSTADSNYFICLGDALDQHDEVMVYGAVIGAKRELINVLSYIKFKTSREEV